MNLRALFTRMLGSGNPTATMVSAIALQQYEAVATQLASYKIGKPTYPDVDSATLAREGHQKIALIARCVSLIADAAGVAPLRVYDEAKDDEDLPDHPMRALMRRPNPEMGPSRFLGMVAMHASLAGFCVIEKERNRAGQVIALWPLEPDRTRAVLLNRSAPAWDYQIPGVTRPHRFQPEDVIHFTWRDRFGKSPYGLGALEPAIREMALLNQMTDFLKVLFEHGGVPLWGLIPDPSAGQLTQEKADQIQERFLRRHGGLSNSAIPMIMSGIKDAKQFSLSPTDLALIAIRDLSELAICTGFGIPPRKAGIRSGLEHSTENATAQVEDGEFYRDTMIPFWTRMDEALTLSLLPDFDTRPTISLGFDTSDIAALQEDRNAKATWVTQAVSGGWMTAHTASDELGVPQPPGDDFFVRSFTVEIVPADDPLGLKAAAEAEKKAAQLPPPVVTPALPPGEEKPDDTKLSVRGSKYERYAKRAKIGATNKRTIAAIATKMQPQVSAFFKAQAARVLAKADTLGSTAGFERLGMIDGIERYSIAEIDWLREAEELQTTLRGLYELSGTTAFSTIGDQLNVSLDFSLANPNTQRVRDLLAREVKEITDESRAVIQDVVSNGLTEGKSITQITDDLKSKMDGWTTGRAERVARTESMFSYGEASYLGYKESGVIDRAQIFDNANHTDDYGASDGLTCATRDGIIVPLDEMMDHIYADHPNGSATGAPVLTGEEV